MRRILFPIILGLAGCGVLIGLGLWQLDRLAWKEGILAEIDARLTAAPVPLSVFMNEASDEYSRVTVQGTPTGEELHVLTSGTAAGTGYRVISKVETDKGAILVDQGLLPLESKTAEPLTVPMNIVGTLLWPDDQNSSTPQPDFAANIWFARNVETMAETLGTQPLLVVASRTTPSDPRLTPLPVTAVGIKNDHFMYAMTWFSLAFVWAAMSLYLIFRTLRQKDA